MRSFRVDIRIDDHFCDDAARLVAFLTCQPSPLLPPRLRALAQDLDRLRADELPRAAEIAAMPRLERWRIVATPDGPRVFGTAQGPRPRSVLTSAVWALDPDLAWVRTLSRFYALGLPAEHAGS